MCVICVMFGTKFHSGVNGEPSYSESRTDFQYLIISLQSAGVKMLEFLLSKGFDINGPRNPNSFFLAIKKGNLEVLKYIHSLSPDLYREINSITKTTSLCEAFRHRHVMKYLMVDLKFEYNRKEEPKNILLHAASFCHTTPEAFQYLVDMTENSDELLHKLDEEGQSAADLAINNTGQLAFICGKLQNVSLRRKMKIFQSENTEEPLLRRCQDKFYEEYAIK